MTVLPLLPVMAMRVALKDVEESASDLTTQPHYRFTRQPVKYQRHHNLGPRLVNPDRAKKQPAAPLRDYQGSADSSRSSSPDPGTQRLSQTLDGHSKNIQQSHQGAAATEGKTEVPLSPREVAQYMLGLDSAFTQPQAVGSSTQRSSQGVTAGQLTDQSVNINNNRHSTEKKSQNLTPKSIHLEQNKTSPAQKILSGLRLRRSSSGKDEQLFV